MKQAGIYRKLDALALTTALTAALALPAALGLLPTIPPGPLVARLVSRVATVRADALAANRGGRRGAPIAVRVVDRTRMRAARDGGTPPPGLSRPGAPASASDESIDEESFAETVDRLLGLAPPSLRSDGKESPPIPVEVSGLYDVASGQVLVADWANIEASRFAFTRDVAHAVLDRRFDLARWLSSPSSSRSSARVPAVVDSDASLARLAVVTGDATVQALEFIDPTGAVPSLKTLGNVTVQARATMAAENPDAGVAQLGRRLFVELDGLTFVAGIRGRAPWSAVDEVWRRPPRSTEEILHPEKYERAEAPEDLGDRLPARLRGGWKPRFSDTLGELGVRLFLTRSVGEYRAERAAAGWGGDRVWLLFGQAQVSARRSRAAKRAAVVVTVAAPAPFVAWVTSWDDQTDADDFAAAAVPALTALARGPAAVADSLPPTGAFRIADDAGRMYMLDRRPLTVALLLGAPHDADGLLAQLVTAVPARKVRRSPGSIARQPRARSR